jgi:Organic solute transporter Ostalpha
MTCVAVATEAFGRYCQNSLNPVFAHIWVMVIEATAVTVAMYCLIQFYVQLKGDIKEHKPLLKVAAIKLVIFLSFWQTLAISLLTSTGAIKPNSQIQTPDIKIGIPAMLLDIEMAIFAIFHLWAFSWKPYSLSSKQNLAESVPGHDLARSDYKGGPLGIKAIFEAFNPWDLIKAVGRSARWLFVGRRRRLEDISYQTPVKRSDTLSTMGNELDLHAGHDLQRPSIYPPLSPGGPKVSGAKSYASSDIGEGEELLRHAQANPMSRPPLPGYDSSSGSSYVHVNAPSSSEGHSRMSSDIGVARSIYDGDDGVSVYEGGRYEDPGPPPMPPRPGPGNGNGYDGHGAGRGGQETGVVPAPYPDQQRDRSRQGRVSMPYFPPPPRI